MEHRSYDLSLTVPLTHLWRPQQTHPTCPHPSASRASLPVPTAAASRSAGSVTETTTAWTTVTRPRHSAVSHPALSDGQLVELSLRELGPHTLADP